MYKDRVIQEDLNHIVANRKIFAKYKNYAILITGINGMIGSYLAMSFLKANDIYDFNIRIYALARNVEKARNRFKDLIIRDDFNIVFGDLSKLETLDVSTMYDLIIHAASQTSPDQFADDPVGTSLVNTIGTAKLLDLAIRSKTKEFLFLSTREIYGINYLEREFVDENDYGPIDYTNIRACYPESKRAAENLCIAYASQHKIGIKIARIAHTYGPSMLLGDGRVVGDFINNSVKREPIVLNSDGSGKLALTYIADVIKGIFLLMNNEQLSICNISNDSEIITVKELAQTLTKINSMDNQKLVFKPVETDKSKRYLSSPPGFLNSSKIKNAGWKCETNLELGLRRVLQYYQEK